MDDVYWNRQAETMSPEQLRVLQDAKLRDQIAWVHERSSFYRDRMDQVGITPADIHGVEDLVKFPITEKEDYIRDQEQHPPYGGMLCVPESELVRYWTTSGSTGKPRVFASNLADYEDYLESSARVLWTAGVRPGWKVGVPFSHGHWIGLWGVFDATWLRIGAQIVPLGGYDSEYRIRKMAEVGMSAFCATPTYAVHLSEVARQLGIDVRSVGIKAILTAGEPASPASRARIEDTWGAPTFDFYGNTENMSYLGVDCPEKTGFHFWQDRTAVEVVDTHGNPLPDGEVGEMVFTNLTARSMPAIRVRIGDVTKLDRGECPCGRTSVRVQYVLGRREDVIKIRGINVYPRVVEDVVRGMDSLGAEFRIVFRRHAGLDSLILQVEPLTSEDDAAVEADLRERIRTALGLTPVVETRPLGTLPKSELKAKRVFDERGVDEFSRS